MVFGYVQVEEVGPWARDLARLMSPCQGARDDDTGHSDYIIQSVERIPSLCVGTVRKTPDMDVSGRLCARVGDNLSGFALSACLVSIY